MIGGGSLPEGLPQARRDDARSAAAASRLRDSGIVARVEDGRVLDPHDPARGRWPRGESCRAALA
jgi:hypothetical protein